MPNKNDNCDHYTKLPEDIIIFQILTKLPTKSLVQLRCVSNFFKSLISHPYFLKINLSLQPWTNPHHLIYYESTDYKKTYFSFHETLNFSLCKKIEQPFKSVHGYLRLVGSIGGVICLLDTRYFTCIGQVILWNPFIGRFKNLPSLKKFDLSVNGFSHMAVGFGFDSANLDYKVVGILYEGWEITPKPLIYSVKIGSWRIIPQSVPCFIPTDWSSSVFMNGDVHWLAYKDKCKYIMSFDVANESFNVIKLPRVFGQIGRELRLSPSADEKSLVLFINYLVNNGDHWGVWSMDFDCKKAKSWTRKYNIVLDKDFAPLKIVKDGEILAARGDAKLILIDAEKDEVLDLEVSGLPTSFYSVDYVPSLALIDYGQQLLE